MDAPSDSLARRAARHAALGDPARLAMVDRLSLSDLSPSELQDALGLPSNLVAHHLRVLEHEGLIERRRSEGDARRTYVRLRPASLDGLLPAATSSARRVVFVCTANSARSQLAAALWRGASEIPAASAGTRPAPQVAPGAVAAAARHGLRLVGRPQALADVLADDDVVITVCDSAHEELAGRATLHWSVPDPVPIGSDAAFESALSDLTRRVGDLAPRLTAA